METVPDHTPRVVLFVEDDREAVGILGRMVARQFPHVTIHVAESGEAGLDLAREYPPDVVVTDVNLPGMDGIRMAEEIRAGKPDTRFIVLTGYSDKNYLKRFSDLGFHDYFTKPVDLETLFATIQKCFDSLAGC